MESPMEMGTPGKIVLCSAKDCSYNQNTKCAAEAVQVMFHQDHADCNTYTHNMHQNQGQQQTMEGQY